VTQAEAREFLKKILRALQSNPGYCEPMSDLEIDGWLAMFTAMGLVKPEE
jgi:hypothetical protein